MTNPTQHVHSAHILEKARQDATGETAAGWWQWENNGGGDYWRQSNAPAWIRKFVYRCVKTDKHPDNQKPKLKLIDMSKLPKGTVVTSWKVTTRYVVLRAVTSDSLLIHSEAGGFSQTIPPASLRVAEQKDFTYWGGGKCPVPGGLRVECIHREYFSPADLDQCRETFSTGVNSADWSHTGSRLDIIAYRIVGVADGWTDDPEQAK